MSLYPSYDWQRDTPAFGDDEVGVKVTLAKGASLGRFAADDEWPVFGAYRFSRELLAELGPAVASAVRLVVQHRETGATWMRSAMPDADAPADDLDVEEEGGSLLAMTSCFAVDVKRLFDLPSRPGRYWVFAFAGRCVSAVVVLDVELDPPAAS